MVLIWVSLSCYHFDDHDTSIKVSESQHVYKMSAHFNRSKTRRIHEYMDQKMGKSNDISFVNSEIDATLTLNDNTTVYLKSLPGELKVEVDKDDNSPESLARVKEMCEGIKKIVNDN